MNTHRVVLVAAAMAALGTSAGDILATDLRREPQTAAAETQTITVTVIIIKIDPVAHTISVRDRNQKVWDFVVDPKSGIDLAKYKVGDTVTATIATTTEPATNPQLRARISKQQLIKLQ